jgi:hypothetical protein
MPAMERVVAIEEHFWIPELRDRYSGPQGISAHTPARQLDDLGEIRLQDMDAAGIEMQVISHMQPGTQIFDAETAVAMARRANDALHAAICTHPSRFAGFCRAAHGRPQGRSRRARAHGRASWLQGRADQRFDGGGLSRREAFLVHFRAGAGARRADLYPSRYSAPCRHPGVLFRISSRRFPVPVGGMGIHRGNGHCGHPPRRKRVVRRLSRAQDHPGSPRRNHSVHAVALRLDHPQSVAGRLSPIRSASISTSPPAATSSNRPSPAASPSLVSTGSCSR